MADGDEEHRSWAGAGDPAEQATAAGTIFAEVQRLGVVDSTNRVLVDAAREGAPEGLVAVAEEQTEGRGRLGRRWIAPPGSGLLVSFLFRPALFASELHLLTMTVALAARDSCRRVAGVQPSLKWPNDLEVWDRKLGGVLAEAVPGPAPAGAARAMVVGLGINVSWPAAEEAGDDEQSLVTTKATSLYWESGNEVDRDELLASMLRHLEARYARLKRPGGRGALLAEYRQVCSTIGRQVRVELARGTISGTALDVTGTGRLQVDDGTVVREIEAGDIVHLRGGVHPEDPRSSSG